MPKPICIESSCARPAATRGFCPSHYQRRIATGYLSPRSGARPECSFDGCERSAYGRKDLCFAHYKQQRKGSELRPLRKDLPADDRFWSRVEKTEAGCWIWRGNTSHDGYGRLSVDGQGVYAHIYSWEIHGNFRLPGLEIDHVCFTRNCVNPDHLRLTTHKQNNEHYAQPTVNSTTGARGVTWDKKNRKYAAYVTHCGKTYNAGRFSRLEEAEEAARAKRAELFSHADGGWN